MWLIVIWKSWKDADLSLKFDDQKNVKEYEIENFRVSEVIYDNLISMMQHQWCYTKPKNYFLPQKIMKPIKAKNKSYSLV